MKPDAMVVRTRMAESLGVGANASTTNTLTPTTLKCITQLFESDNCLEDVKRLDESSGFVPPPVTTSSSAAFANLESKTGWAGGTTTVVTPSREIPHIAVLMPDSADAAEKLKQEEEEQKRMAEIMSRQQQQDSDNNNTTTRRSSRVNKRSARRASPSPTYSTPPSSPEYAPPTKASKKTKKGSSASRASGGRRRGDEHLSDAEFQKIQVRRARNKEAAARCRKRRVDLTNDLLEQVQDHEVHKRRLEEEIQQLKGQKEELEFILQAHAAHCRLQMPQQQVQQVPTSSTAGVVVAVKSEPVLVEAADAPYVVPETVAAAAAAVPMKRPASLPLPAAPSDAVSVSQSGIVIETPSAVVAGLSLDSVTTGLTPMGAPAIPSITTPTIAMLTTPGTAIGSKVVDVQEFVSL